MLSQDCQDGKFQEEDEVDNDSECSDVHDEELMKPDWVRQDWVEQHFTPHNHWVEDVEDCKLKVDKIWNPLTDLIIVLDDEEDEDERSRSSDGEE